MLDGHCACPCSNQAWAIETAQDRCGEGPHSDAGGAAEDAEEGVEEAGEGLAVAGGRVRSEERHKALACLARSQPRLHAQPILRQPRR